MPRPSRKKTKAVGKAAPGARSLRTRLDEAEQTLAAIRTGEVDAIIVGGPEGDRVFTLTGADKNYRVLMDEMSEGVATLGADGLVTYCNARFAAMAGVRLEDLVGKSVHSLVGPASAARLRALLKAGTHHVSKAEFLFEPGPAGKPMPVLLSVSQVEMEGGPTLCAIATDLTEQKRQEESLARERAERELQRRASEARYRRIVETAVEGIWLLDAEARGTFANRALADMLGYAPDELTGRPIYDFLEEESARAARRFLGQNRKYAEMREFAFRRKDGGELWAVLSASPVAGAEGELLGAVVMLSDVSERRKLQAQLLLADRMSSLGTLAAGVAHEINNPLAYTIGSLDLLSVRLPPLIDEASTRGQAVMQELQRAREGMERVRIIVRDLKSFSRADEETVTAIDVRRSLDTSLTLVGNEIKHRARLVRDYDQVPAVRANEGRLGQVFINLLVNAAQSMPEGRIDDNELRVVGLQDALGRAVIEIHDTGCGIPAENLDRIFEPFFTTKAVGEGTGLGLAICHGIVASFGGSLSVESTVGKGSVFRVTLPAAHSEERASPRLPQRTASEKRRGRVLVIDDEEDLTEVTREALVDHHDVMTTGDARQALEWIEGGDRFDLILCDMMMPQMTGMEFYSRLVSVAPRQAERVVFMTGGAFTPRAREFLARLPNLRIEKPFDLERILTVVNGHLEWPQDHKDAAVPA